MNEGERLNHELKNNVGTNLYNIILIRPSCVHVELYRILIYFGHITPIESTLKTKTSPVFCFLSIK